MAGWGWVAAAYGAFLAASALLRARGARRLVLVAAALGYAALATLLAQSGAPVVHLVAPGGFLLGGYWLSGPLFDAPQPRVERWLLNVDARAARALGLQGFATRAPRWLLELLEAAYAADYVVVGGGALLLWTVGVAPVVDYWTIVLAAELTCYAALPWIRTRPPRAIEPPGALEARPLVGRKLNGVVLHNASVHANTIPSGHVAGALASALAVHTHWPDAGVVLLALAALISIAAVAGRYHYLVDVVLGAIVAVGAAWLVGGSA